MGPAPPCPLTLVLLHERPHVPLLRAVCEGAVPHVLALAAVLRVDAELRGEGRASWVPLDRRRPSWRTRPPRAPWHPRPRSHSPRPHAGTHVVLLWEVANGWQWPHRHPFPLGLGHHQKDPPLLGPAAGQRRGPVREGSGRASGYVTSTERRPPCLWCLRPPPPPAPAHQCRALALQYLRSLSGSTTCPFLQHWPHTNFICRSKVLGPCAREAPCRRETSEAVSTRAEALGSATQVASGSVRATQLLGMGWSSITYWWEVTPNCTQRLREVTHPPMGKWPEDRDLT